MRIKLTGVPALFQPPKSVLTPFRLMYLLTLGITLFVLVLYFRIQPSVPLFYSLSRPAQHLAPKEWLWLFPGLAWVITLTHLLLVQRNRAYNLILIQLFSWTTVLIELLLGLALLRISMIVS